MYRYIIVFLSWSVLVGCKKEKQIKNTTIKLTRIQNGKTTPFLDIFKSNITDSIYITLDKDVYLHNYLIYLNYKRALLSNATIYEFNKKQTPTEISYYYKTNTIDVNGKKGDPPSYYTRFMQSISLNNKGQIINLPSFLSYNLEYNSGGDLIRVIKYDEINQRVAGEIILTLSEIDNPLHGLPLPILGTETRNWGNWLNFSCLTKKAILKIKDITISRIAFSNGYIYETIDETEYDYKYLKNASNKPIEVVITNQKDPLYNEKYIYSYN